MPIPPDDKDHDGIRGRPAMQDGNLMRVGELELLQQPLAHRVLIVGPESRCRRRYAGARVCVLRRLALLVAAAFALLRLPLVLLFLVLRRHGLETR